MKIFYDLNGSLYANITNKCDCACTFCIRQDRDKIGEADNLWHKVNPTIEDIKKAIDDFDFTGYDEFVFCGYGEPTCELDNLLEAARYLKEKCDIKIRLNTNGLGNLYNKKNIVPDLAKVIDSVSISLNAPDAKAYQEITRPMFEDAFKDMIAFASECNKQIPKTALSVVDVLSKEDIEKSQKLADELGIYLRVRKFGS